MFDLLLFNAPVVGLLMVLLWAWSVVRRDASVVDPWWPLGFLLITLHSGWGMGLTPGRWLLAALVAVWSLRLGGYLFWRNWGKPEDKRYQKFRREGGGHFWWTSLFTVFGLQGALMLVISLPLQVAMRKSGVDPITGWDVLGALLVLVGVVCEAVADAQMAEFKRDPEHKGKVMDLGLWRYSRHPNYFGEALTWWGFWVSALDAAGGAATWFCPALMTFLLLRVSGVTLLESDLKERKPEYAEYVRRTSAFIPLPQKS